MYSSQRTSLDLDGGMSVWLLPLQEVKHRSEITNDSGINVQARKACHGWKSSVLGLVVFLMHWSIVIQR